MLINMKKVAKNFLPPFAYNFIKYLAMKVKRITLYKYLKKNLIYKDLYLGESVCIIGNGPSINQSKDFIKQFKNTIAMNNFHKSSFSDSIKPVAYCIGEPVSSDAWSDPLTIKAKSNAKTYWVDISNARVHTKENRTIFNYVNGILQPNDRGYIGDMHSDSLGSQTTAVLAIQVAIYMGFSNITLVGFEHSWLATPDHLSHFYSSRKDDDDTIDQFTYDELMNKCVLMWSQYRTIQKYAEKNNITIKNATPNSYLDVFPRQAINISI